MNLELIINNLKAKLSTLSDLSGKELFFVTKYYWQQGNSIALQACKIQAKDNLKRHGYIWCEGIGWCKEKDIPNMGISNIYGRWKITDLEKYRNYNGK